MQEEKSSRYHTTMYIYDCTGSRVYKIKRLLLDRLLLTIIMEINLRIIMKRTQTKLWKET